MSEESLLGLIGHNEKKQYCIMEIPEGEEREKRMEC